jgi:hypothetical protein
MIIRLEAGKELEILSLLFELLRFEISMRE